MFETLQHIIRDFSPYLHQYGYFILALSIAIEGFGIPAPGQSFLIVSGILAAGGEMSLLGVLIVAGGGAFIGNTLGYFIGLKFGDLLLEKGWIKAETEQKLHSFIDRYGIIALLMSRFVEGLKQTMCIGCGIAKLPARIFFIGNAFASCIWVLLFGLLPAILRQQIVPIMSFYHEHRLSVWFIGSFVALLSIIGIWLWQRRKRTS